MMQFLNWTDGLTDALGMKERRRLSNLMRKLMDEKKGGAT